MRGEVSLSLLFIIPVLTITGPLGAAGALLLPLAIVLLFLALVPGMPRDNGIEECARREGSEGESRDTRWGGVIMIGPIPIVFGSAKGQGQYVLLAVLMAVALMAVLLILLL